MFRPSNAVCNGSRSIFSTETRFRNDAIRNYKNASIDCTEIIKQHGQPLKKIQYRISVAGACCSIFFEKFLYYLQLVWDFFKADIELKPVRNVFELLWMVGTLVYAIVTQRWTYFWVSIGYVVCPYNENYRLHHYRKACSAGAESEDDENE